MAGVDDLGRLRESGPRELEPLHSKNSRSGGGDPVLCGVWCLDQTWGFAGMSSEWLTSWPPTAAFAKEAVSAQCSSANPGLQSALAGFVVATTSFHLARTSFFFTSYCTLQDAMHFFCGKLVQALVGGILLFTKKDFPSAAENLQQKGFFMSGHRGSFSNFKF